MEHGGLLLSAQDPAIGPYPELEDSSQYPHVLKISFYIIRLFLCLACGHVF